MGWGGIGSDLWEAWCFFSWWWKCSKIDCGDGYTTLRIQAYFALFCFKILLFIFYRLIVCGNPAISRSISNIFLISLCHILVIQYFKVPHYYYICYDALQPLVIFDGTIVNFGGHHEPCSCKMAYLINVVLCLFWLLHNWLFPMSLSLSLGLFIPQDTTILKLDQIKTLLGSLSV